MPNRPIPRNLRLMRPEDSLLSENKPKAQAAPPEAPSWLSVEARPHWDSLAKQMQSENMWRPVFERTLAIFCELLSVFLADPKEFGPSKLGQLRLLAGDLGLSPSHFHRVARTPGR